MDHLLTGAVLAEGVIDDAIPLSQVFLNALRWLLSWIGILGIAALALAGVFYVASSGNETRTAMAKRMVIYIVTGLAIALTALLIVRLLGRMV